MLEQVSPNLRGCVLLEVVLHGTDGHLALELVLRSLRPRDRLFAVARCLTTAPGVLAWREKEANRSIHLVPNAVRRDFSRRLAFDPKLRRSVVEAGGTRGKRRKTLVLAHCSNFRVVKRPVVAALAAALLEERLSDTNVVLLLIGDGPLLAEATTAARSQSRKTTDSVLHVVSASTLPQHEVARRFAVTDLVLVSSQAESFCLAAAEGTRLRNAHGVHGVWRCGGDAGDGRFFAQADREDGGVDARNGG